MTTQYRHRLSWLLAGFMALVLQSCASNDQTDSLLAVDTNGYSSVNLDNMRAAINALPKGQLTPIEEEGILYMREEEKLARDVYLYLFNLWNAQVFDNIEGSEQTHTDTVLMLVERYGLVDPVSSNGPGVFQNPILQNLYNNLVSQGSSGLIEALKVGALIEEVDIVDIERYIAQVEGNDDIVLVYENLMKGSRNHLRAFVRNLERKAVTYQPQYLDANTYQSIINSPMEQ